jgi:hypothetical protein
MSDCIGSAANGPPAFGPFARPITAPLSTTFAARGANLFVAVQQLTGSVLRDLKNLVCCQGSITFVDEPVGRLQYFRVL